MPQVVALLYTEELNSLKCHEVWCQCGHLNIIVVSNNLYFLKGRRRDWALNLSPYGLAFAECNFVIIVITNHDYP
jgi:hypothetical protein